MKIGEPYWTSREKRALDVMLGVPMYPAYAAAKLALRASVEKGTLLEIGQLRVGSGSGDAEDRQFIIWKAHTQDESVILADGTHPTLSSTAALFCKLGIDELRQAKNIWKGEMSAFGPRPLVLHPMPGATSYLEVMDSDAPGALKQQWASLVRRHQPGVLGTWPIHEHTASGDDPNRFEMRMSMDLEDAHEESLVSNLRILRQFVSLAIDRRLQ